LPRFDKQLLRSIILRAAVKQLWHATKTLTDASQPSDCLCADAVATVSVTACAGQTWLLFACVLWTAQLQLVGCCQCTTRSAARLQHCQMHLGHLMTSWIGCLAPCLLRARCERMGHQHVERCGYQCSPQTRARTVHGRPSAGQATAAPAATVAMRHETLIMTDVPYSAAALYSE
jgi:hypothetical protein